MLVLTQGPYQSHPWIRMADLVYDYTFLCAIPPVMRGQWAAKMASLVKPGGELLTLIFPICDKVRRSQGKDKVRLPGRAEKCSTLDPAWAAQEGGPPYRMSMELVKSLLEPVGFESFFLEDLPPELSHPGREGKGNWGARSAAGRWRRLAT
jgi:methyl halide transferase